MLRDISLEMSPLPWYSFIGKIVWLKKRNKQIVKTGMILLLKFTINPCNGRGFKDL